MGYFFLDDSKHPKEEFFLTSFVFCSSDPQRDIEQILLRHGLQPGKDEFKSSAPMRQESANSAVRKDLRQYLGSCKVGVAISSTESDLCADSAALLQKMLGNPDIGNDGHSIFVDQGIAPSENQHHSFRSVTPSGRCQFNFEQDSKAICGIQLADLSAHTCATMLKGALGLIKKTVRAGESSGYGPNSEMELAFEMFAMIRYSFLGVHAPYIDEEPQTLLQPLLLVSDYGLQVSNELNDNVKAAAQSRFGSLYLGCIH